LTTIEKKKFRTFVQCHKKAKNDKGNSDALGNATRKLNTKMNFKFHFLESNELKRVGVKEKHIDENMFFPNQLKGIFGTQIQRSILGKWRQIC